MNLEIAINIFGWLSAITIISLSIPQLLKVLKDKKTGEINFISFWIFHIGILGWVFFAATSIQNLITVIVADGAGLFINGVMTGLLYHYKKEFQFKKKLIAYVGILVTFILGIIFIALFIKDYPIRAEIATATDAMVKDKLTNDLVFTFKPTITTVIGLIFPAFTTFAFLPQLITSFKLKDWRGVSIWMFVAFQVNNLIWIIWWVLLIVNIGSKAGLDVIAPFIVGLIWQITNLVLYAIQIGFTLHNQHLVKTGQKTYAN
ncbi:PQ-loop domain-containing transporter [Mycoplasma corogypsi]|uniref:PQ-loop domain-containing transporter n=1 Tax=Mycoplasma corogypsi TaxID=2106 RepID=UPI003872EC1C